MPWANSRPASPSLQAKDAAFTSSAPDGQRSAQAMMEDHENAEWMRGAVRNLPDKYRAVLRMRQVEHLEMGEIARIIGATEGVVRTILSRARKQMMEQLKVRRD